ncbi:Uncharacterized protein Adt_41920 [Abeliophyllum distichum]|uniref:Uncharacterized protein n=1 Tax=Abeliophyllum distichum TaxID=126358 RepID=A0ABD1PQ79_9LAMI
MACWQRQRVPDDALNAQAITTTALEKANEEKKARSSEVKEMMGEVSSSQSEISTLKADLETSAKSRSDAEGAYVNLLAEKKMLKEKLAGAEAEFTVNFHKTKASANFSAFFASVVKQEVITAFHNNFPNLNVALLEAKFPPLKLGDDADSSNAPDE